MNKSPSQPTPDTMSTAEVAERIGITADAVRRQIARGAFPVRVVQIGRCNRIVTADYEAFLAGEARHAKS